MFSYQFYLVLHVTGTFMILASLGGIALHVINGGTRDYTARKWAGMFHGIGLTIALVGGFGLLARLGLAKVWPTWVIVKLVVWIALGAMPALLYRQRQLAKVWWLVILALAATAVYMASYKPTASSGETSATDSANDPALQAPIENKGLEAVPPAASTPNP